MFPTTEPGVADHEGAEPPKYCETEALLLHNRQRGAAFVCVCGGVLGWWRQDLFGASCADLRGGMIDPVSFSFFPYACIAYPYVCPSCNAPTPPHPTPFFVAATHTFPSPMKCTSTWCWSSSQRPRTKSCGPSFAPSDTSPCCSQRCGCVAFDVTSPAHSPNTPTHISHMGLLEGAPSCWGLPGAVRVLPSV